MEDDILYTLCDEHPHSDPEHCLIEKDEHSRLQKALSVLSINERQCIIMKFYNHMKLDEIADALNISKSTVKRYIAHAETVLRKQLKQ